jgi:eukaryotic-like serine/threonine-protein kinase
MGKLGFDVATFAELERLLDAALDVPPAARAVWLESLGPESAALKPQLRALLERAAEVETSDFLQSLPGVALGTPDAVETDARIGPWRLIRELGRGGMGSVWLARRADGLIDRPVALKLPHRISHTPGLAERMARERQILAALDHPNIARLYDVGLTDDGQSYLALEYVDGRAIDAYCRSPNGQTPLDLRGRLQLFVQVTDAVAYAHGKLIVHRDLKPANVLVTEQRQVRLLDFGIAKLLDEGVAPQSPLTEMGGRAMTPEYASPEQIRGEPLTVAADIYSLGVLLYELLAERLPYNRTRRSRGELEEAILNVEPPRPSDVAPGLRRALRGDLDTIVLKALKKPADERYATANALADDIRRYLDGRPVLAQADSARYRLGKFVRRHKLGVTAAAAVLAAVIGGASAALWQAHIAAIQARRAEEVKSFIVSILRDADLDADESKPASVRDLLKQAAARVAALETQPAVRVELLNLLGTSLLSRGDTDTMEAVVTQAIAEGQRSLGADHPLTLRARMLMVWVHSYRGRTQQMGTELDAVMALMARDPQTFAADLVDAWRMRADQAIDAQKFVEAEADAKEAVARAEAAFGPRHRATLEALGVLVTAYRRNDKVAQALETAEHATRLAGELFPQNSLHPLVVNARAEYARTLADAARLGPAVEQLELALADAEKLYGPNGRTVGFHLQNLAGYQLRLGLIKAATDNSARALNIQAQHAQPGSFTHASTLNVYGQSLLAARRGSEALPIVTQTEQAAVGIFGPSHPNVLICRANRALALGLSGNIEEARRTIAAVLGEARGAKTAPARVFYVASAIERFGADPAKALQLAREALPLLEGGHGTAIELAQLQTEIGLALVELGAADAMTPLDQARSRFAELEQVITPAHADALIGLGRVHLAAGRSAAALPLLERADQFWRSFDAQHSAGGVAAFWLSRGYQAAGQHDAARAALARARELLSRSALPAEVALLRSPALARHLSRN